MVQAIAVLRYLGSLDRGEGVNAIARALGISPSSCFNILKTLAAEDLVAFDPGAKRYTLGLGTMELARAAAGRDAVLRAAAAPMRRLAEGCDAGIGLWRLAARERLVLVAMAESPALTRIHMVIGQRHPVAAGATGRAMLAARRLDDAQLATAFEAVRWQKPPTLGEYVAQVREAEALGWAIDADQLNRGILTVAAAIRDGEGAPRFMLSASMFNGRDGAKRIAEIGSDLKISAGEIGKAAHGGV